MGHNPINIDIDQLRNDIENQHIGKAYN